MRRILLVAVVTFIGGSAFTFIVFSPARPQGHAQNTQVRPELVIYSEEHFGGRSLRVTGSLVDLPKEKDASGNVVFDWNDSIKSVEVIQGTWRLYQHGRQNTALDDTPAELLDLSTKKPVPGWSCLLSATTQGVLPFPTPAAGGFFQDVSSIELVSEMNLPEWAMYSK